MLSNMFSRIVQWARRQTMKRRARQRVAELERRLLALDQDTLDMAHFPPPVLDRMAAQRGRLITQLENAKKFV